MIFLSGIFNHEPKTTKHSDTNNLKKTSHLPKLPYELSRFY